MPDQNESGSGIPGLLKTAAPVLLWAGAMGSVVLTLIVGRRNSSVVLIAMFVGWAVSPFVGMWWALRASAGWSKETSSLLGSLVPLVSLGSLAVYARVALGPSMAKPAAPFLMVPLLSWVFLVIVLPTAALFFRRRQT